MGTFQINYNSAAATALNALNDTSEKLNTLQRQLSTGLRINDASDDPAGLIKSETFRTQILGVNQAKANAQEAINYIRTADAQMNEITSLLQSAKGFALQAQQSATIDDDQRSALNAQLKKAIAAIDSTARGATYGSKKILDGTAGIAAVGIDGNTNGISFTSNFNQLPMTATTIIGSKTIVDTPATVATLTGTVTYAGGASDFIAVATGTVNVTGPGGTASGIAYTGGGASDTIGTLVTAIDGQFGSTGVHAAVSGTHVVLTTVATGSTATITLVDANSAVSATLTAHGADAITHQQATSGEINVSLTTRAASAVITGATTHAGVGSTIAMNGNLTINGYAFTPFTTANTPQNIINAINNANLGITASYASNHIVLTSNNLGSKQKIKLVDTGGIIIAAGTSSVSGVNAKADVTLGTTTVTFDQGQGTLLQDLDGNQINLSLTANASGLTLNTATQIGQLTLGSCSFCIDPSNATPVNISLLDCSSKNLGLRAVAGQSLANVDLSNSTNTANSILIIDQAIKDIINRRATVGSIQKNTLESALRSLRVSQENLQASESNIRNLDFADAISQSIRLQILNSSGMAQLAQANQYPQNVLNLLKG